MIRPILGGMVRYLNGVVIFGSDPWLNVLHTGWCTVGPPATGGEVDLILDADRLI